MGMVAGGKRSGPDCARGCAKPARPCHTARQSSRAGVFRGRGLSALPSVDRGGGAEIWAYCLMPNLVHLPIMPTWRDAGRPRWAAGDLRRSAPPLHRSHQRSVPLDGPSIPGPLRRGGDGRAAPAGGNALERAQSGGRGAATARIERAATIGRPLGAPEWIAALERRLGRRLAPGKPGPKPRMDVDTKRQLPLL